MREATILEKRQAEQVAKLIEKHKKKVAKMTPRQVRKMLEKQAESWARQDKD